MKISSIGTHIKTSNFSASKNFYETLGFTKVFEYGPELDFSKDSTGNLISAPEGYHGATFKHGDCKLEIADGHRAVKASVFEEKILSSKMSLMVEVDDVEELLRICEKKSIPIAVEPRHYYWGTLEVVIKDPDGTVLVFVEKYSESRALSIGADETFGMPPKK